MNTRNTLLGLLGLVVIVIAGWGLWTVMHPNVVSAPVVEQPAPVTNVPSATTTVPNPPETESTTASLNQRILSNGVHITPLSVVSDSRCPTDVQCIQAGTVSITAKIEGDGGVRTQTFVMGSPVSFGSKHVTLMSVTPAKNSKTTITAADYRFTFSVAPGMGEAMGSLQGTMTIAPACPVENATNPCKPTPAMFAARKVAIYQANRTTLVTTLTPGADGTFSASLPAGTYYVRMAVTDGSIGRAQGVPTTITIKDGGVIQLHIDIDSLIR